MRPRRAHLILPCETRAREFEAKLLLACHAAERGWRAIVGEMTAIDRRAARFPRSVYVGKGVTANKLYMLGLLRRLGHTVTAWDEEGLVHASPEIYRATKVDPAALNTPARLFAWGEANARAWRDHPGFAGGPISVTGNPRTDLLRPELRDYFAGEAEQLRARHGAFILINTNFSRLNHFRPGESLQRRLLEDGGGRIVSEDDPRLGLAAHKQALFRHFLEMAPAVAKRFPERKLILRPHPSESPDAWREALADCPNAEVIYEGNAAAWLMAARAMVHNGCTTAVESFLLDRPAIAYQPVRSERYDHPLPNGLSLPSEGLEELFERLGEMLENGETTRAEAVAARQGLVAEHIASYQGPRACERILDELDEVVAAPGHDTPGALARALARAVAEGRGWKKRARERVRTRGGKAAYLRHKFPPLDVAGVDATIRRFGALLGRFEDLRVERLDTNIFVVSRA